MGKFCPTPRRREHVPSGGVHAEATSCHGQRMPRVSSYFAQWVEAQVGSPLTRDQYEHDYHRSVKPWLGGRSLATITPGDIRGIIARMRRGKKSAATIRVTLAPLRAMFTQAVKDGLVSRNPVARLLAPSVGVLPPPRSSNNAVVRVLTSAEMSDVLATCRERYPNFYPFILMLACTGITDGEACALQWSDIDWSARCVLVWRTLRPAKWSRPAEYLPYPKTSAKYRRVSLSIKLVNALQTLLVLPGWQGPVFTAQRGGEIDLANFRKRIWSPLLREAGVPHVRLQDLRHTLAVQLLREGKPIAAVARLLGHASSKANFASYAELMTR